VRNELIVATLLYAVICVVLERRQYREVGRKMSWRGYVASYGLPALIAIAIAGAVYSRSVHSEGAFSAKHTLNMCQVYAFGYQQRHPEWGHSPWLECEQLMERDFGQKQPSLSEMMMANPFAAARHFGWNLALVPIGLELSLFNAMWGSTNPDYTPVTKSLYALILGLASLATVIGGSTFVIRDWRFWWTNWFRDRSGLWLIMFSVSVVAIPVILTQRPRPSYLFALTVTLMAVIGTAVHVLGYQWLRERWRPLTNALTLIIGLCLLILVPSYYATNPSSRPLYRDYTLLLPFKDYLIKNAKHLLIFDYPFELTSYLGLQNTGVTWVDYLKYSSIEPKDLVGGFLDEEKVDVIFLQPRMVQLLLQNPKARLLVDDPQVLGWDVIASRNEGGARWLLLHRTESNDV
jgi:hypothetical protein